MTHTEALTMALEALNKLTDVFLDTEGNHGDYEQKALNQGNKAITVIKEALAQPEYRAVKTYHEGKPVYVAQPQQEPVAWRTFDGEGGYEYRAYEMNEQYAQEWEKRNPSHKNWVEPLYTSPPQRTWVGLTFAEICECESEYLNVFARAIEAKLKDKNK